MIVILIPYYKIRFFEKTLASVAFQSNKNFQLLICDDCSPENPIDILKKYQKTLDFRYHRFTENMGRKSLTDHWQRCLDLIRDSSIEWISILGDDDVLDIDFIDKFYQNLEKICNLGMQVVRYATVEINESDNPSSKVFVNPEIESCSEYLLRRNKRSSLSEYVFNWSILKNIGFRNFPLGWFSDNALILEISNFKSIYSINDAVVLIRVSNLSISGRRDLEDEKAQARLLFFRFLGEHITKFDNSGGVYNYIRGYYLSCRNIRDFNIFSSLVTFNFKRVRIKEQMKLILLICKIYILCCLQINECKK